MATRARVPSSSRTPAVARSGCAGRVGVGEATHVVRSTEPPASEERGVPRPPRGAERLHPPRSAEGRRDRPRRVSTPTAARPPGRTPHGGRDPGPGRRRQRGHLHPVVQPDAVPVPPPVARGLRPRRRGQPGDDLAAGRPRRARRADDAAGSAPGARSRACACRCEAEARAKEEDADRRRGRARGCSAPAKEDAVEAGARAPDRGPRSEAGAHAGRGPRAGARVDAREAARRRARRS